LATFQRTPYLSIWKKKKKKGMIFLTFSKPTPSLTQKNGKKGQIHKKKKKKPSGAEWRVMIRGENNNKEYVTVRRQSDLRLIIISFQNLRRRQ
jgi:hypothetical protein